MALERLQKVLAAAGLASRRECEEMILDGRVSVNGKQVSTLPVLVDPDTDRIAVDGQWLRPTRKAYIMLHKPKGVHCTNDESGSKTRAVDLLVGVRERVFSVGRLDAESTGLVLLTNDGELAERLTRSKFRVPTTYRVHVPGLMTKEAIPPLLKGVWMGEAKAYLSEVSIIHAGRDGTMLEVVLCESRNREVRRVLLKLGLKVRKLVRIRLGSLSLGGLPVGSFRSLTAEEVQSLREYRAPSTKKRPKAAGPARKPRESTKTTAEAKSIPVAQSDKGTRRIVAAGDGVTILRRRGSGPKEG